MAISTVELKFAEEFKRFLTGTYDNPRVISDCLSRCRRVQKYEGDLWGHFQTDKGRLLIGRLTYTLADVKNCVNPIHSIPIQGSNGFKSTYDGTQSLSHAISKYFEFLSRF